MYMIRKIKDRIKNVDKNTQPTKLKLRKTAFKNIDTYKDRTAANERVWLD